MGKKNETKKNKTIHSEAGKGSVPRRGISQNRWEERWEKIFGKKEKIKLYKVENIPVKETPRYDGDGTEWLIERDEQGKLFRRIVGTEIKEYINND